MSLAILKTDNMLSCSGQEFYNLNDYLDYVEKEYLKVETLDKYEYNYNKMSKYLSNNLNIVIPLERIPEIMALQSRANIEQLIEKMKKTFPGNKRYNYLYNQLLTECEQYAIHRYYSLNIEIYKNLKM